MEKAFIAAPDILMSLIHNGRLYDTRYNAAPLDFSLSTRRDSNLIVLSGQIYEQIFKDNEKALEYYMRIINNYSDSIYFEPIRYHIRKIKT